MTLLEAIILGIIQGLTEFLPVSSSGHIELGKVLLNVEIKEDMLFTMVVHGATVLSTIAVFYKDIIHLIKDVLSFGNNEGTSYMLKLVISMVPIAIVGVFFKEELEMLFNGNLILVGAMLIITSALLFFTHYSKTGNKAITYPAALIIGVVQTIAVLPGISRSGSTIATGLLLGAKKEEVTKFSFLMVLIPILGANVKALFSDEITQTNITVIPLIAGFITAFVAGFLACKWMIKIVNKGKLSFFAIYCLIVGIGAVIFGLI